jgi:hypothetical protein
MRRRQTRRSALVKRLRPLVAACCAWLAWLCAAPAAAQGWFQFAVIGDAPYYAFEEAQVAATLRALGSEPIAFVIHVGDIKGGGTPCSDEVFAARHALLDGSPLPLILTPGDNEWVDCRRARAGAFDPLERLEHLRATFFAAPESLGRRRIALERQPGRAENARWRHDGVLFITLNVPGSENNARMPQERDSRMQDNLAWLDAAVTEATAGAMRALVVIAHAEPFFAHGRQARDPYAGFRSVLASRAQRLGKPMLLVHGDDHRYAFDQPLVDPHTGRRVANVHRVAPYGSPAMAPAVVTVNPTLPTLFEARSGLVP